MRLCEEISAELRIVRMRLVRSRRDHLVGERLVLGAVLL
jgi:hypothetical protein